MDEKSAHYTVLARRFRPQTFGEVVGQQHVARALKNAIHQGRVAHAYLFTGARGVGKTSMARILAKALNCPNAQDGEPCNACDICRSISTGSDVDVLEIDGASNRGIDDIRSLRANVNVKSMRTRFKIYIIDEVHMLTKEAFNALLKTLEEPPPTVKFVFCTTEVNKVPDTILSRCQRFDFATIETQNIVVRLQEIAAADGFDVDPAAVELVARRANGSMRDSQSLFDQLLAFGGERITSEDVHRLLGTAGDDRLIELVEALITHRGDVALQQLDRAVTEGVQLGELIDQLLGFLRDLMVIASGATAVPLMSVSEENRARLSEQAGRWGLATVVAAMEILAETKGRMFRASHSRALAELCLVRLSMLEDLESLDRLVRDLRSGANGSARVAVPSRPAVANRPASVSPPVRPSAAGPATAPEKKNGDGATLTPVVEPDLPQQRIEFRAGCEKELWTQILSRITDMLKNHAKAASSLAISGPNSLDLLFPPRYHFSKTYCEKPDATIRLERLIADVTGQSVKITIRFDESETAAAAVPQESRLPAKPQSRRPLEAGNDEFVQHAMAVFGGTIVRVDELAERSADEDKD